MSILISLAIAALIFCLAWWLIALIPLPPPPFPPFFKSLLFAILIIVALIWLVHRFGGYL